MGNHLILTFIDCGSLQDARQVFDRLPVQDELTCTSLMYACMDSKQWHQALLLFEKMRTDFEVRSPPLFVVLLKACAQRRWFQQGKELHLEVVKEELERELQVGTALLDMYAKCGAVAEARDVFDELWDRDVVSWTALIGGYTEHGFYEEALGSLDRMKRDGIPINAVTYVCSLKACGCSGEVARGLKLHAELSMDGLEKNFYVCSSLVDMYAGFGLLENARRVLNKMHVRDTTSWNALITSYVEHGLFEESLECMEQMQADAVSPDAITYVCILKACNSLQYTGKGQEIHAIIYKMGYEKDVYLGSVLVDMYTSCGSFEEALYVFHKLPYKDVVSWTALVRGYIKQGLDEEAFHCLEQMQFDGVPPNGVTYACSLKACTGENSIMKVRQLHVQLVEDGFEHDTFVGNTLLDIYAKSGLILEALDVFDELQSRSIVSWNSIISAYVDRGYFDEALLCLEQMESERIYPDAITYACCFKACGSIGAMEKGRQLHIKIIKEGFESDPHLSSFLVDMHIYETVDDLRNDCPAQESVAIVLANAVIDMYGRCGSMIDSQIVFDDTPVKDILTWTALVSGYSRTGDFEVVFLLLERMEKESIKPDSVIFLGLLNVCSHLGLIDACQKYFNIMDTYGIQRTIEHYNCMIDLYCRAGMFEKAMQMLAQMPFEPDFTSWNTMLYACQRWGPIITGKQAFGCATNVGEDGVGWFILMSNIYAASQFYEE
ncbi:hypothetical protein KP509_03G027500 [Ceratopteris richardii]|nr:hypothetical protein KP509_03G027500 [Ceratopteris richardii]